MKLATLCYLRRDGHTLMIHRVKKANDMHAGKWNGLGGKLEPGETPEECVIREVWEEAGLRVECPKFRGMITFPRFSNDEDWYAFVFVIDQFAGELIDSPEGHLKWIPDKEILDLNLWEGDRIFIPWLDRPGFFSGKFVYQDGRLVEHSMVSYDLALNTREDMGR
jgi:8-oxo-dGTP diphosphatase